MTRTNERRAAGWLVGLVLLTLSACTTMDQNIVRMDEQVSPVTVGDSGEVPAAVLAAAMLRAGFSNDEILHEGTQVHDALATSGGAQVRSGDSVLALFAVHDGTLYVTSRTTGTFQLPIAPTSVASN